MPGPDQVIRTAVGLPWAIARRIIGLAAGILPGGDEEPPAPREERVDVEARRAATDALRRDREPVEEAIFTPPDDFFEDDEHVDTGLEVVAESADPEATDPPGPQLHVDEPWEGYRRMKVAEIIARLDGQSAAVLAAVELYESTHRKRRGVLEAVETASRA